MNRMTWMLACGLALALIASSPAGVATTTCVTAEGVVIDNLFFLPPLDGVSPGDPARLSFRLTGATVDGAGGTSRGHVIDPGSFALIAGAHVFTFTLPTDEGRPPLFVLTDDPDGDAFSIARQPVPAPLDVELAQNGALGPLDLRWLVRLPAETLDSLEVEAAYGVHELPMAGGNGVVVDGHFDPLVVRFTKVTIGEEARGGSSAGD